MLVSDPTARVRRAKSLPMRLRAALVRSGECDVVARDGSVHRVEMIVEGGEITLSTAVVSIELDDDVRGWRSAVRTLGAVSLIGGAA